ncbi:metallophosphoesterase [Phenylobacterium sp.]|uniref:metallophosphoesterase family protein n=1 Tax=Phenylobacterium sp. TaxID=1871053 RepID=UPI00301E38D6
MIVRIAHLSDIHFGGENAAAVAAAGDLVRAGGFDLTVVSGDLTRFAEVSEFELADAWLAALPGPRMVTPGNHDAPYLAWAERIFAPFRRFERFVGPARLQTWRARGVGVVGVNTARGAQPRLNWSKGQISARQADEAAGWFQPDDRLRIVVVHHPLIEMIGGPMTARVWGGEQAAARLAEARVDLVLSGHIHAPFVWPYPHGDGRTWAVGAGTLSVRERGVPPGFNTIEVEDGTVRVTALAWTGSSYEPFRTWALERRPGRSSPERAMSERA